PKAKSTGAKPSLPVDDPSKRRLPPVLRRAWYHMTQAFRRRLVHLELTPHQFTVLRWLQEEDAEDLTQRRLSELMASDPNTVTSVLSRMETAGLVERKPHKKDRRAKCVRIKPRGRSVYEKARQIAIDLQTQVLGVLPASKRDQFLADLEAVADAAQKASGSTVNPPEDD
ncbi:MAG: MarR family winged helix-turn-helix transcriptional regulator, partial [Phycisphaeraceae bacterium]|nr:MarR family winged helix-turn-helix transcriptional regulator [Phycisphaeraceae bacterium]